MLAAGVKTDDYERACLIVATYAPGELGLVNHLAMTFESIRKTERLRCIQQVQAFQPEEAAAYDIVAVLEQGL